MKHKHVVVMPLYIWPVSETTWQPLHEAILAHPNVTFLVIVNPNSGPGGKPLPAGQDYQREVPKLNAHANVITVGYVRVGWGNTPFDVVVDEIDTFANWNTIDPALGLHGIYLDETPNHYTPGRAQHLDSLKAHIKASEGFRGDRLVIHNPGTPPDKELVNPGPDIVCTCEEPYEEYNGERVQKRLEQLPYDPSISIYQISGIPAARFEEVTRELCKEAVYIFATDLVDDFYESFGESWLPFVSVMGKLATETPMEETVRELSLIGTEASESA